MKEKTPKRRGVTSPGRRKVLKGLGVGSLAGTQILHAPMIWANKLKDVTLRQVGPSYSVIPNIAEQARKDLGFRIETQTAATDALMVRVARQPETLDIADLEYFGLQKVWGTGNLQPVDIAKIERWEQIIPLFREGKYDDGTEASTQGTLPYEVLYADDDDVKRFADGPTARATVVPTIYNADTLGIRPDLIGRNIDSWAELFNPEFKGKTALLNIPQIGIMDAAMAIEARGDVTYGDKGNMTREEIDKTIDILIDLKKQGHFRSFWSTFDESVNLMAAGEVVIQSMWSPAVTVVRTRGIECTYQGLQEGYRGWGVGMGMMGHLEGLQRDAAYEYLNWYLSGWQGAFIARQGYYNSVPETVKTTLPAEEWDYWYGGKPAAIEIKDPYGATMEQPGRVRDGGSFEERMGNIACWNTVMDEDRYMIKRWNEFISS